jgi:hypothetical protein
MQDEFKEKVKGYKQTYDGMLEAVNELNTRANQMFVRCENFAHTSSTPTQRKILLKNVANSLDKLEKFYKDVSNYAKSFELKENDTFGEDTFISQMASSIEETDAIQYVNNIELKNVLNDYYFSYNQIEYKYGIKIEPVNDDIYVIGFKTKSQGFRLVMFDIKNECITNQSVFFKEKYVGDKLLLSANPNTIVSFFKFRSLVDVLEPKFILKLYNHNLDLIKQTEIYYSIESMKSDAYNIYCLQDYICTLFSTRLFVYQNSTLELLSQNGQNTNKSMPFYIPKSYTLLQIYRESFFFKDLETNKLILMTCNNGLVTKVIQTGPISTVFIYNDLVIIQVYLKQLTLYDLNLNIVSKKTVPQLSDAAQLILAHNQKIIFVDFQDLALKIVKFNYVD